MSNLINLRKLASSTMIGGSAKLQSPPDGYCLIVYQNLSGDEVDRAGIGQFYIKIGAQSQKQTEMIGSSQRETIIFESPTYPEYLFMMVYDYSSNGLSKSSLYYRWRPYDLGSINYIKQPNMVFNAGIAGCLSMDSNKMDSNKDRSFGTTCKYKVGESIQIKNRTIRMSNPFRDEYITYKVGRISQVLPLNSYGECYYNILFDDRTEGVEVSEKHIQKYYDSGTGSDNLSDSLSSIIDALQSPILGSSSLSNKTTLANLALLNNLNQTVGKSNLSLLSNLNQTVGKSKSGANNQLVSSLFLPDTTQDVGENPKLQEEVTKFYLTKTIKWLGKNQEFAKVKKQEKFIKSKKGSGFMYKILKSFIKKNQVNWYELRADDNYEEVKDYIREKLLQL